MKSCIKCGKRQRLSEYYKHPSMKDGHLNKCKECCRLEADKTRKQNIHYYREYDKKRGKLEHRLESCRKYRKTIKGKESILKGNRKYRQSNLIKYKCHTATNNAIRDGKLIKKACITCGNKKAEAHHKNYLEPLKVTWLCSNCHKAWHKSNKHMTQFKGA